MGYSVSVECKVDATTIVASSSDSSLTASLCGNLETPQLLFRCHLLRWGYIVGYHVDLGCGYHRLGLLQHY